MLHLSGTVSALTLAAGADNVTFGGRIGGLFMGNGHDLISDSTINSLTGGSSDWVMAATPSFGDGQRFLVNIIGTRCVNGWRDHPERSHPALCRVGGDTITMGTTRHPVLIAGNAGDDSIVPPVLHWLHVGWRWQ